MRISPPGRDPLSSGKCFDKSLRSAGAGIREAGGAALYEIRKVTARSGEGGEEGGEEGGGEKEGRRLGRKEGRGEGGWEQTPRRLQVNGTFKEAWEEKKHMSKGVGCPGLCSMSTTPTPDPAHPLQTAAIPTYRAAFLEKPGKGRDSVSRSEWGTRRA